MVLQRNAPVLLHGTDSPRTNISVDFLGHTYSTLAGVDGQWSIKLPQQSTMGGPSITIKITGTGQPIVLNDIVFGDVVVCSGQSNMELSVIATVNQSFYVDQSSQFGANIRLLQVSTLDSYGNVTTPQTDFSVSQPWTRASPSSVPYFSALCYYYAVHLVTADPSRVFGLIDSSWGGTLIEPWMDPASLHACGEGGPVSSSESTQSPFNVDMRRPDVVRHKGGAYTDSGSVSGVPSLPSTLFNSMIAPLVRTPISTVLWYQGESNAANPVAYSRCFPAFITGWRQQWLTGTGGATDPELPFVFVQLSSWPAGDNGMIAVQRFAQLSALNLQKVGMAVAADLGDPASPFHPIHPPWKYEVARRVAVAAQNVVYGQVDIPKAGPSLVHVYVDLWNSAWGEYHLGFGSGVCGAGTGFLCLGIRLEFDQELNLDTTYGQFYGFPNGFELFSSNGQASQPVMLTGLKSPNVVQLNATWTFFGPYGAPGVLRYAWHDYPVMLLTNGYGQPVIPFNASLA